MEVRETDKLFRDKLKNAPTAPHAASWEKLETMLDEQKKAPVFLFWRVAAAVLLLMISGLVVFFWTQDVSQEGQVAMVEEASESLQGNHVIIPEIKINKEPTDKIKADPVVIQKKKKATPEANKSKVPNRKEQIEKIEPVEEQTVGEIDQQSLAQAETKVAEKEDTEKRKIKSIRITYKRGRQSLPKQEKMVAQQKVDTTGNNKIKELWEQTKEIKPGDLWADIRDAKDNLFQKNSKKNNVKNLNK